jgi:hypothetical protein
MIDLTELSELRSTIPARAQNPKRQQMTSTQALNRFAHAGRGAAQLWVLHPCSSTVGWKHVHNQEQNRTSVWNQEFFESEGDDYSNDEFSFFVCEGWRVGSTPRIA